MLKRPLDPLYPLGPLDSQALELVLAIDFVWKLPWHVAGSCEGMLDVACSVQVGFQSWVVVVFHPR